MTKPVIVREDGTVGPTGLRLIEQMASEHKTQRTIAASLGVTLKKFEKMMEKNKGDNDVRVAWENGFARFEQLIADKIQGMAFGDIIETDEIGEDGSPIIDEATGENKKVRVCAPVSKAQTIALIFFAKTQLGWSEKPTGPLVQDNRIQITLPDAQPFGALMKALGQTEIIDARKDKTIPLKDITPEFARLEAPKEGTPDAK